MAPARFVLRRVAGWGLVFGASGGWLACASFGAASGPDSVNGLPDSSPEATSDAEGGVALIPCSDKEFCDDFERATPEAFDWTAKSFFPVSGSLGTERMGERTVLISTTASFDRQASGAWLDRPAPSGGFAIGVDVWVAGGGEGTQMLVYFCQPNDQAFRVALVPGGIDIVPSPTNVPTSIRAKLDTWQRLEVRWDGTNYEASLGSTKVTGTFTFVDGSTDCHVELGLQRQNDGPGGTARYDQFRMAR